MKNPNIAKVLKEYRKKNKYTVQDVSVMLKDRSIKAAPKTIYGWESGQSSPSADILLTLCELYNIENILSAFGYSTEADFHLNSQERALIRSYREHPEFHDAINTLLQHRKRK